MKNILITAGPTIEPLDPVRFLSNYSTGEMGYRISEKAVKRGFQVCLISGPTNLRAPQGVDLIRVNTAREMRDAVMDKIKEADCLIMSAAVCDFRPKNASGNKIKKGKELVLELERNPDILMEAKDVHGLLKIGFALETEHVEENGRQKMKEKNMDMIIVNAKSSKEDPFGPGKKNYCIISRSGEKKHLVGVDKAGMAEVILDEMEKLLK